MPVAQRTLRIACPRTRVPPPLPHMGIGSGPVIGVVFCNGVGILGTSAPTRTPNPDSSDGGFRYRRQLSSHIGPDYLSGTRRARAGLRAKHYHIMLTDKGLTFPASFSIVSSYNARQLSCHRLSGRWHPLTYAATPTYRLVCTPLPSDTAGARHALRATQVGPNPAPFAPLQLPSTPTRTTLRTTAKRRAICAAATPGDRNPGGLPRSITSLGRPHRVGPVYGCFSPCGSLVEDRRVRRTSAVH